MRAIFTAFLFATAAFAGETNEFSPCVVLSFTNTSNATIVTNERGTKVMILQPLLEPAKLASVTNGITLGQVVTNLEPGWMTQAESVGIIRWSFRDGRELQVKPLTYTASDVLFSDVRGRSQFWLTTNEDLFLPK